ncbi:MAG: hypothetical protein ACXVXC_17725 [Nocardioidaceae bacterium]
MATWRSTDTETAASGVPVSHTRVPLVRPVAFRFALDVTAAQHELLSTTTWPGRTRRWREPSQAASAAARRASA